MKKTPARIAVDRAAKACDRAYLAMQQLADHIPETAQDQFIARLRDYREWTDYLDKATWPDKVQS